MHRLAAALLAASAATAAAAAASPEPGGAAAGQCTFDGASRTVTARAGFSFALSVDARGRIMAEGDEGLTACGQATVRTADRVLVRPAAGSSINSVDLSLERPFAPGATPEPGGQSEIEIDVRLASGGESYDSLSVRTGDEDDDVAVGSAGIAVNGDGDVDVTVETDRDNLLLGVESEGGDDRLSGRGGAGSGEPWTRHLELFGGLGGTCWSAATATTTSTPWTATTRPRATPGTTSCGARAGVTTSPADPATTC